DKVELEQLRVEESEIEESDKFASDDLKNAIEVAKQNIFKFHSSQKLYVKKIEINEGITCWRKSIPIEKVGLYIPGGTSPLFSTLLMLGVPAKIAECKEISVCTPPQKDGKIAPQILYVAKSLGIENVFKVGGAHAIAAMAYGTETITKVDKIFGPGNQWVTAAKQLVNADGIAIDMPAGPSEVLVIADDSANPKFVAADLLSQAEHGPDSQVVLITNSENLVSAVTLEIDNFKKQLSRKNIIEKSLKNSVILLVKELDEAITISNNYAPEHLILAINNPEEIAEKVTNAGSVFLGNYSPESAGDYATGTNHTLPTNGFASAYSGVSLDSFLKKITFQKLTKDGLSKLGKTIQIMAEEEGLDAHKLAVTIRTENGNG
ncbi:MAG: histidinol dehydrogenase, partial [Melioribacteraceae bacterium]|nr:histidinol dehydrogenase [Melioribacteraceae bacterium]